MLITALGINSLSKLCNIGAIFLTSVFLSRALGAEGFGVYSYALAFLGLLFTPLSASISNLLVRELSLGDMTLQRSIDQSVVGWSASFVRTIWIASICICGLAWVFLTETVNIEARLVYTMATIALLFILTETRTCGLIQSNGRVVLAQITGQVFRPVLYIIMLVLTYYFQTVDSFTASTAMAVYAMACFFSVVFSRLLLSYRFHFQNTSAEIVRDTSPRWFPKLGPLLFVSVLGVLNGQVDIIILGLMVPDTEIGIYRAVLQFSFLLSVGLLVVNTSISHQISGLKTGVSLESVQSSLDKAFMFLMLTTVPAAIFLLLAPQEILSTFFGGQFGVGKTALQVHTLAQLVNSIFGSVGIILLMTGNERFVKKALLASLLVKISLCALLIPSNGMVGASIASLGGVLVSNIYMWRSSKQKVGLNTLSILKLDR